MEVIILADITYIHITFNSDFRRIYTDGREWPKNVEPSFSGYSIGKWIDEDGDGKYDVLEVETRLFKGPRAYDASGIPLHRNEGSIVKERFFLDKADKNIIYDEITVIDDALTRPWSTTKKASRNPKARPLWRTEACSEGNSMVNVGGTAYFLSWDGYLMPT